MARFIHRASPRKDGPFIAINCAALPEQLLESELFGYERGAFTGAQQSKVGQIELASNGVLFLDAVDSGAAEGLRLCWIAGNHECLRGYVPCPVEERGTGGFVMTNELDMLDVSVTNWMLATGIRRGEREDAGPFTTNRPRRTAVLVCGRTPQAESLDVLLVATSDYDVIFRRNDRA